MRALRIVWSRIRIWAARQMLITGRGIIEAEERAWGLRPAPGWRVPNVR